MYPDAVKSADNIDIDIAKDITSRSLISPMMWDPAKNYQNLNLELAFPSVFNYGWPAYIRSFFSPQIIIAPATSFTEWGRDMCDTKTWSETGSKIASSFMNGITATIQTALTPKSHRVSTYISNTYLDKQGRLKGINPAPAITR